MVHTQHVQRQEPTKARHTEGSLRRRKTLADAAVGISPDEADVPTEPTGVARFRCVIYLSGAPDADLRAPREECTGYAGAFGWDIADVIEEHAGLLPPDGRDGLRRAVEHVQLGGAGAVLTAWRSMISPVPQEYDAIAREIEKAGGFLHVPNTVHQREDQKP
ncbi:recombinase family protein [Streptomyces chrestomyceticus]|uniref:recombinase family protein n=1 Tax=Streptomyces chrestomyceticus TaxID=68185 RepID=UPI0004C8318F